MSHLLTRYAWLLVVLLGTQLPHTPEASHICGCTHRDADHRDVADVDAHEPSRPWGGDQTQYSAYGSTTPLQRATSPDPRVNSGQPESISDAGSACRGRAGGESQSRSGSSIAFGGCVPPSPVNPKPVLTAQLVDDDPQYLSHNFCSMLSSPQKDRLEVFCRVFGDAGLRCEPLVGAARNAADKAATSAGTEVAQGRARWHRTRLYHLMRQVYLDAELLKNEGDVVRDTQRAFGVVKDLVLPPFSEIEAASDLVWEHVQGIALMRAEASPTATRRQRWTAADLRYAGCKRLILPLIDEDLSDPITVELLHVVSTPSITNSARHPNNGVSPGQAAETEAAAFGRPETAPQHPSDLIGSITEISARRYAQYAAETMEGEHKGEGLEEEPEWQRSLSAALWAVLLLLAAPAAGLLALQSAVRSPASFPAADLRRQVSDARSASAQGPRHRRLARRQRKKSQCNQAKSRPSSARAQPSPIVPSKDAPHAALPDEGGGIGEDTTSSGNAVSDNLAEAAESVSVCQSAAHIGEPYSSFQALHDVGHSEALHPPPPLKKSAPGSMEDTSSVSSALGPTTPAKTPSLPLQCSRGDTCSSEASYSFTPPSQSPVAAVSHISAGEPCVVPRPVTAPPSAAKSRGRLRALRTSNSPSTQPHKQHHSNCQHPKSTAAHGDSGRVTIQQTAAAPQKACHAPQYFSSQRPGFQSFAVVAAGRAPGYKEDTLGAYRPLQERASKPPTRGDAAQKTASTRRNWHPLATAEEPQPIQGPSGAHSVSSSQPQPQEPTTPPQEPPQPDPHRRFSDDIDLLLADVWAFTTADAAAPQPGSFLKSPPLSEQPRLQQVVKAPPLHLPSQASQWPSNSQRQLLSRSAGIAGPSATCHYQSPSHFYGPVDDYSSCSGDSIRVISGTDKSLQGGSISDHCLNYQQKGSSADSAAPDSLTGRECLSGGSDPASNTHTKFERPCAAPGPSNPTAWHAPSHQAAAREGPMMTPTLNSPWTRQPLDEKAQHRGLSRQLPPIRKVAAGRGSGSGSTAQYQLWPAARPGSGGSGGSGGTLSMPVSPLVRSNAPSLIVSSPSAGPSNGDPFSQSSPSDASVVAPCSSPWWSGVSGLRSVKSLGSTVSESASESASRSSLRPTTPAFVPATSASLSPASCAALRQQRDVAVWYGGCTAPTLDSCNSIVIDEALGLLMSDDDPTSRDMSDSMGYSVWDANVATDGCRRCGKPSKEALVSLVPCGHRCTCAACALGLATTSGCCPVCHTQVTTGKYV